jgi:hypothetical protein
VNVELKPAMKACVACKSQIPSGASLCSVCKTYQRVWKNHLQYIAGIVALVSLSITGVTWASSKIYAAFFARSEVHLITCNTLKSATIANTGDTRVFISHLTLWMVAKDAPWVGQWLELSEKLDPGQFLTREFPRDRMQGTAIWVRGLTDAQFKKLVERAAASDPCVEAALFGESDSFLYELKAMTRDRPVQTFEVAGFLEYWDNHGRDVWMPIKGAGVLRVDSRQTCLDSVAQTTGTNKFF